MGLIGNEIIQTRTWVDPNAPAPPSLNYKYAFPITVFEAVRRDMYDEDSETLLEALERIEKELMNKQPIFAARPSNYLMTFAGTAGAVGAIQISQDIPWDPSKQSNEKIPTEKAVGDLLYKLGLTDKDGKVNPDSGIKVRWSDVIGRPLMYDDLGWNEDGFMTQKAVTTNIASLKDSMEEFTSNMTDEFAIVKKMVTDHTSNINNPHHVTIDQIGAISKEVFQSHLSETNPHNVTKDQVGLGNVDNTADIDKPISKLTQNAIDELNRFLNSIKTKVDDLNYISNVSYDQPSGALTITYSDNSTLVINIPIDGLVDEIQYDSTTKELVVIELSGNKTRVNISELFVRYYGSIGPHITVEIDEDQSYVDPSGRLEITREKVRKIWAQNGIGNTDADDGEINKPTVDNTWETNGEGSTDSIKGEITKETVDYTWDTNGNGPFDEDEPSSSDVGGKKYIIKAFLNELSITEEFMANDSVSNRILQNNSVSSNKIADGAVTNNKLADKSITGNKLAIGAITTNTIAERAITGNKLFSSEVANRILAVRNKYSDPVWTQIIDPMIADEAVTSRALKDLSITRDKISDKAIITRHLENESITNDKLAYRTITNSRIAESTIEGSKLKDSISLPGTPTIGTRPTALSNNNQIPDTRWVKDLIASMVITNNNLDDRIVNGRTLFTSSTKKRALVVNRANSDPEWGQIEKEMMANDSVDTNQIVNNAVTNNKIADNAIESRHFTNDSIKEDFLKESSVSMNKIVKSESSNMILGVTEMNSHPRYTKVTRDMLDANAVGGARVIEDKSVPLSKLVASEQSHRIIGVGLKGSNPEWMQVTTNMIANHAVTGQQLFTSPSNNRVLAVTNSSDDPSWLQVQRDMIAERAVDRLNIATGAIWQEHLQEGIIENRHLADRTISSDKIAARSINGEKLFTSPMMNRVLAVIDAPYTDAQWVQVTNEMLADGCIDRTKLFQSNHPNRVLGVTEAGVPPEYLMITNDFIMDDTIKSSKLTRNLILKGTPELTVSPDEGADNHQIADTSWVRSVFKSLIKNFDAVYGTVTNEMLGERSVTGDKLFTSHYDGPRLIGVTKANEDPEYLLVEEEMIADGAVTTNKIQRDVHLLGSPVIDIRPTGSSSDANGGGDLIPDCQWVLDRIAEAGGTLPGGSSSGGTGVTLTDGSVITKYIQDRSVIGSKLFTSSTKNRVLAVINPNTDPVYTQINSDMISDRQIIGSKLFTSEEHNRVLAVGIKGSDPQYMQINNGMIADNAVTADKIAELSINTNHIVNNSITFDKLANEPLVDTTRIQDNSVTTEKIADNAIETEKIEDKAVTSDKLEDSLVLRGTPTIKSVSPETRSLKNFIISSELPTADDGEDGDIWITYI